MRESNCRKGKKSCVAALSFTGNLLSVEDQGGNMHETLVESGGATQTMWQLRGTSGDRLRRSGSLVRKWKKQLLLKSALVLNWTNHVPRDNRTSLTHSSDGLIPFAPFLRAEVNFKTPEHVNTNTYLKCTFKIELLQVELYKPKHVDIRKIFVCVFSWTFFLLFIKWGLSCR